jgi:CheY-like chemotaxis protein
MAPGKILIVEDNPLSMRLAQFVLDRRGFNVRMAANGAECLAELARELPDLILMDIQLPGEDGLAITRSIRADSRIAQLVIVAVTAQAMKGDRERILGAGCDGYISKPIEATRLADEVEQYLKREGSSTA